MLHHLRNGFWEESVQHRGNAQLPPCPGRIRDVCPPHRLQSVGPAQELFPDGWRLLPQVPGQFVNAHPVHPADFPGWSRLVPAPARSYPVRRLASSILSFLSCRTLVRNGPSKPSADVCRSGRITPPAVRIPDGRQISRGKLNFLQHITAGLTTGALDGSGRRRHSPIGPKPFASHPVRGPLLHDSFRPRFATTPCALIDRLSKEFSFSSCRICSVPQIGIGGSLAAPPLPHHRTYGSVYGGSTG